MERSGRMVSCPCTLQSTACISQRTAGSCGTTQTITVEPGMFIDHAKRAHNTGKNKTSGALTSPLLPGLPVSVGNPFPSPGDTRVKPWSVTFDSSYQQISTVPSSIAPAREITLGSTSPQPYPPATQVCGSQPGWTQC